MLMSKYISSTPEEGRYDSFPEAAELKGLGVKAMTELGSSRVRGPDLHPKKSHSRKQMETIDARMSRAGGSHTPAWQGRRPTYTCVAVQILGSSSVDAERQTAWKVSGHKSSKNW